MIEMFDLLGSKFANHSQIWSRHYVIYYGQIIIIKICEMDNNSKLSSRKT